MTIVGQTRRFVTDRILSAVKQKHRLLFSFGLQVLTFLTFTAYESLGSNARLVIANLNTTSSKIYRLVSNKTLLADFSKLVSLSGLVQKTSLMNVDFSTFCGFETLYFAVQTTKGRAIPVWNACITYPITFVGSQNLFVLEQIKAFGTAIGLYPRFVFDRGFWIPLVMQFLFRHEVLLYLRIKQGQLLVWKEKGESQKAKTIGVHTKDTTIMLFGYQMCLIVSAPPPIQPNLHKEQHTERWYILTNDMDTSERTSLPYTTIYKTRFEIEEMFKDYKHIQKLKVLRIKMKETFTVLLWFASLTHWIAWWIQEK